MGTVLLYVLLSLPLVGAYIILGMGLTVIYQASRVLNLAHGALAMGAAYVTYQAYQWQLPLPLCVVLGIAFGAVCGVLVEAIFVRRLRSAGPTSQTVGTVAFLSLSIAVATRKFGSLPVVAPAVIPRGAIRLAGGFVPYNLLFIFPIALAVAVLLFILFEFTDIGLKMRGAAQNRRGAALRGVNPDRTAALAWALAGGLAGLAGILLAGATGLDPFSLSLGFLPAFVAALIGGLESMPGVVVGAVIIGLVQGMVPLLQYVPVAGVIVQGQGTPQLALGVLALAVMALRGSRLVAADARADVL